LDDEQNEAIFNRPPFEKNSNWWPRKLNPHITTFCSEIQNKISYLGTNKVTHNLTTREIKALNNLKQNKSIIIKKGDKSSGVIVMDAEEYRNKIMDMLNDADVYTKTNKNDTNEVKKQANKIITDLYNKEKLNDKQLNNLTDFIAKCPIFYGIPKIHKPGNPLRPIVSQINGPTSSVSKYVSEQLAVAEKQIPFILQDTTAFLQLINTVTINKDTKLVTMDVVSLYTNIPHEQGAEWVSEFYHETLNKWSQSNQQIVPVSREEIKQLLLFVLRNSTFEFNNEFYHQNYGTTMGASFSVRFANIYMHKFLQKFCSKYDDEKPQIIARLIDDIFFTWNAADEKLQKFIETLNNDHPTIKFEPTISDTEIHFLDTVVYKKQNDNKLHTQIYRKPTYRIQYLHFNSNHPRHVKTAIPYSQALRYRRIIDDEDVLVTELEKLKSFFELRGYPPQLVDTEINKVKNIARENSIIYKSREQKQDDFRKFTRNGAFLPLIITYDERYSQKLRAIVTESWQMLINTNENLKNTFKQSTPQIVYKRGQTLSNILIRARFNSQVQPILGHNDQEINHFLEELHASNVHSVTICGKRLCKCCHAISPKETFISVNTKQEYAINENMNCDTQNIIYLITCKRCKLQYVGETERRLKDRLNAHRSNINIKRQTAVAIHFNNHGHNIKDLIIMPIEKINNIDKQHRQSREKFWIKTLKTNYPNGLNYYPIDYSAEIHSR